MKLVTDGTSGYLIQANTLQKVNLATGASAPLSTINEYTCIAYGNSVLYGATKDALYSIHVTTGVATLVTRLRDIKEIMYQDTTTLVILTGNSMVALALSVSTATGTSTRTTTTVTAVSVTAGGFYTTAPSVTFSGGAGTGAAGTAVLNASGAVVSVTITAVGAGYTSDPTVTFGDGDGAGAGVYLRQDIN